MSKPWVIFDLRAEPYGTYWKYIVRYGAVRYRTYILVPLASTLTLSVHLSQAYRDYFYDCHFPIIRLVNILDAFFKLIASTNSKTCVIPLEFLRVDGDYFAEVRYEF